MQLRDAAVIEDWLTKKRGQKVVLRVPQKGMKEKLVELAEKMLHWYCPRTGKS